MSLRDEHLQQALKHAPDSDLAPSEFVRKNVLNYAKNSKQASQKPHGYKVNQTHGVSLREGALGRWLAGLLPNIKNWQWAGMSSVAVALLAALMLREQLPLEITQPKIAQDETKKIAQNSAPAPEKALKEDRADMAAAPTSIQEEAPARRAGAREKAKAEASATTPELADKDIEVVAAAPEVVASAPAEQSLSKEIKSDLELKGGMVTAPASDAVALPEQADAKPAVAAKKSAVLEDAGALGAAKAQGVAKAKHDIQAGVLRILVAEWPADKSQLDKATGYRVELVTDLVPAELEAYNQTMHDWFRSQQ